MQLSKRRNLLIKLPEVEENSKQIVKEIEKKNEIPKGTFN